MVRRPFNSEIKLKDALEEADTLFDMTSLSKSSSPLLTLTRFLYLRSTGVDVSEVVTFNSKLNSDILTRRVRDDVVSL